MAASAVTGSRITSSNSTFPRRPSKGKASMRLDHGRAARPGCWIRSLTDTHLSFQGPGCAGMSLRRSRANDGEKPRASPQPHRRDRTLCRRPRPRPRLLRGQARPRAPAQEPRRSFAYDIGGAKRAAAVPARRLAADADARQAATIPPHDGQRTAPYRLRDRCGRVGSLGGEAGRRSAFAVEGRMVNGSTAARACISATRTGISSNWATPGLWRTY